MQNEENNPVTPKHYSSLTPSPVEVIEAWSLNFNLGNCLKYIARAGKKPNESLVQDLEKALWYLKRRIEKLKEGK